MTAPADEGPATVETVAGQLGLTPGDPEREHIAPICTAVNALIREWKGAPPYSPRIVHGAILLAARLHRRRNSPSGVESYGELGPVYVQRNDPDVAMMLGIGAYAAPRIG